MKQHRWWIAVTFTAMLIAACSQSPSADITPQREAPVPSLSPSVVVPAGGVDLTVLDATDEIADGVWVEQSVFDSSTGTGVFESFVRLNSNQTVVTGFNTSGRPLQNDEMASANFTRDLPLSAVPLQPRAGETDAIYREFRADINQTSGGTYLSLDVIQVAISKTPGANPAVPTPDAFGDCSALVWEMPSDAWIALSYLLAPGSGNGDMRLLIPDQLFTDAMAGCAAAGPWYVYLYSEFGGQGVDANDVNWGQDNGFEEWSVRKAVDTATAFKTANGTFDRTWTWTIDKSVDPDAWDLFVNDEATSGYTVSVSATPSDGNFQVTGQADLINAGSTDLRMQDRTDEIGFVDPSDLDGPMDVQATATLVCDETVLRTQGNNKFLDAGDTLECTYTYTFAGTPATPPAGQVWANRVTFDTGTGQGVAYTATVEFEFLLAESFDREVDVTDAFDGGDPELLGTVDAELATFPVEFEYDRDFTCSEAGSTDYPNVATIVETEQTADASVTVNCYELDVDKDAETSFGWDWAIDKAEDADTLERFLYEGEVGTLNYTVTASATATDHAVAGTITVVNDAPIDAVINGVTDVISPDIAASVDCGVTFPYDLVSGATLECSYDADLPDGAERTNTATATQQNYAYDAEGAATDNGTTDYSAQAPVVFGLGDDNCVEVVDDKTDPFDPVLLGIVCAQADDGNPEGAVLVDGDGEASFSYALTVGKALDVDIELPCGDTTLTNEALVRLVGGLDAIDTATWTVVVSVYCPPPGTETAWAANGGVPLELPYNPGGGGNWATYVDVADTDAEGRIDHLDGSFTTTLFAGQFEDVGTVTFSAPAGGYVTIDIVLTGGWVFAPDSIVAVQDYESAPSGNPSPGLFDHKVDASGTTATIVVPENAYYGVHAVVQ